MSATTRSPAVVADEKSTVALAALEPRGPTEADADWISEIAGTTRSSSCSRRRRTLGLGFVLILRKRRIDRHQEAKARLPCVQPIMSQTLRVFLLMAAISS